MLLLVEKRLIWLYCGVIGNVINLASLTLLDEMKQIIMEQRTIEGTIAESSSMILKYKSKAINITLK